MKTLRFIVVITLLVTFSTAMFGQTCSEGGSITKIKNRKVGRTEYVIFDIKKSTEYEPKWEVSSAKGPFTDYSGDTKISVRGSKFRKIVFRSFNWMCETPTAFRLPKSGVRDIKKLYAFEGIAEFIIGYHSRARYITTYSYDAGSKTKVVMKFRR